MTEARHRATSLTGIGAGLIRRPVGVVRRAVAAIPDGQRTRRVISASAALASSVVGVGLGALGPLLTRVVVDDAVAGSTAVLVPVVAGGGDLLLTVGYPTVSAVLCAVGLVTLGAVSAPRRAASRRASTPSR